MEMRPTVAVMEERSSDSRSGGDGLCSGPRNPISGAGGGQETERHLLAQEQKICKVMARKFTLETNRRRKVLDERRRQWDIQEQRLREKILQQRRQQVQDATERFQRAHLPPSQRRRQTFRRKTVSLEDALKQIQGTLDPSSRHFSSSSCTPVKPPIASKSPPRQTLSSVESRTKLLQEVSPTHPQPQDRIPQDSLQSDCCNSESLSCKDSLECEDDRRDTKNHPNIFSSFFGNSEKTSSDLHNQNHPTSDLAPYAGLILVGGGDALKEPIERNQKTQDCTEWPPVSKTSWGFKSFEGIPAPKDSQAASLKPNLCEPEHCGMNTNTAEAPCPKPGALLDLKQHVTLGERQGNYPVTTEDKNGNKMLFRAPNISLNSSATDNTIKEQSVQQRAHDSHRLSSLSTSINNLNKSSNSQQTKTEKLMNSTSLQSASTLKSHGDAHAAFEEELQTSEFSEPQPHSSYEVRFIKGILKKHSHAIYGEAVYAYNSGLLSFPKQVALSIRDSVELTRAKSKEPEGSSTVKKKLRWLDEVSVDKESKDQNLVKHTKDKSGEVIQMRNNHEDHQLSATTPPGTPRPGAATSPADSTASHFTKVAWADVGVQVSLAQEQTVEVKVPRSSNRSTAPKVPRRECPARVGAGPVSSRTRKGTLVRPQSATEVSQIAKTQGQMMIPRPPPRMEAVEGRTACDAKAPYGVAHASVSCKQAQAAEQMLCRSNSDLFLPSHASCAVPADRNHVAHAPPPLSIISTFSEGNSKTTPTSFHQEAHNRARGTVLNKLECTPTDEEISQLWNGVRSALTTKEAKIQTKGHVVESGRAFRKPCLQPPPSGNRKLLLTSQQTNVNAQLLRSLSTYSSAFPKEGGGSSAQSHLANVRLQGLLEATHSPESALESVQTHKQHSQQQALTSISLEEQKILLSLDRLNHQLHCVQKHGFALTPPCMGEVKGHLYKRTSSASPSTRAQKKV